MSKKIKKQIEKSIPFFVIISLIASTTAMGLFFNLDYNIYNLINKKDENAVLPVPKANADTASTTVEVKNAPPAFTVQPAEVPVSTSTSPVNLGDTLTITAIATDGEPNEYYLIICSSDSIDIDEVGGLNHSCGDVTYGSSTLTTSGQNATTTFTVIDPADDPGTEIDEWYAFVCDNHATQADCSLSSQGASPGSGDSSSPFYINHAPLFTAVNTTSDNKDPGNAGDPFVVTATTTDSDIMGGEDIIELYVCSTDDWTVSSGCTNVQLCYGTSTSPNVSCSFATGTPAVDGNYPYYAYVKDWHDFASAGNSQTNDYNINNVAPTVSNVVINGGEDILLNMRGMDEYVATTSSASISDNNGCQDIENGGYATGTIYWSDATGEHNCAQDDDDCYPIANTFCTITPGSCTGSSDSNLTYTCSTTIAFHAIPTDNATGSPYWDTNWLSGISVFDDDGTYGTATSVAGVDVVTLTALDVTEAAIPYGAIKGGQNSGDYNATTTIVNYGNSPLNAGIDVNDMDKDDPPINLIEAENQQFATSTFIYGAGTWSVEEASSTLPVDIDVVRPTYAQTDVSDQIYWGIAIPSGKPSGTYTGLNTFTAILDSNDW